MILEESSKFSETVLWPLNQIGDKEGAKLVKDNKVKTPKGYKEAYDQFVDGGWQALSFPTKYGGQGFPSSFSLFRSETLSTANFTWGMFPGLSSGCINTLIAHGSEELKKIYLAKLIQGSWTGTMCLTEPQCGSDLGQVATKAEPMGNGAYKITGTKIFISCGDHDLTDNIIHSVLARLPNAPEGTKGISLFLVPKYKVNKDGSIGEFNRVNVGRIEEKMGCHGSPTCEIQFDGSEGYLIGTENRGLNHMFTFINISRIGTAVQGLGAAELAFQKSYPYTLERGSMRSLTGAKQPDRKNDPLIVHPDIRRMLLTQKAYAEGGRAMIYACAKLADVQQKASENNDQSLENKIDDRLGFLTPILKGFLTEKGLEAANYGIQIWGGHGYITENGLEQIVRDARISTVWEGTTGIQALDLLGRKVLLQKIKPLNIHVKGVYKFCWEILTGPYRNKLATYALQLAWNSLRWQFLTYNLARRAMKDRNVIGAAAFDYLMYSGYNVMGEMWLKMAQIALKELDNPNREESQSFYKAKIETCDFCFSRLMPQSSAHAKMLKASTGSLMRLSEKDFLSQ